MELLHEVIVSGGAVTSITTGTITGLSEGVVYKFEVGIKTASTTPNMSCDWFINGDSVETSYNRAYLNSKAGTAYDSDKTQAGNVYQEMGVMTGFITVEDSYPMVNFLANQYTTTTPTGKDCGALVWVTNTNHSGITEFEITGSVASQIGNGSYLRIWEGIQSD